MNVNKKLDRFKQWAGERMGGEVKTNVSDDFKAMELETAQRQEGMEKMHKFTANYVKSISKRAEGDNKEKLLPIAQLGGSMIQHGDEFEHDSQYGQCLGAFGRTQERLARTQDAYIAAATNTWLESLERGLVQMKEYQAARKKLDTRRLAYDTSLAKLQKAKREDFRVEEELRSQKAKYEEAEEDVYRRMMDIKDSEGDSVQDLTSFLEAQLTYHEKCKEALMQLREQWPAGLQQPQPHQFRPGPRPRSNTARSFMSTQSSIDERPTLEVRTAIRPGRTASSSHFGDSPVEYQGRPQFARSTTYDGLSRPRRDMSPVHLERLARVPSDSLMIQNARSNLKNAQNAPADTDVFADDSTYYTNGSDRSFGDRSFSPAPSHGSGSVTPLTMGAKKAPPPPPPSRASKPAPPPPPAKRTLMT